MLPRVEKFEIDRLPGINWHAVGWRGSAPPLPVIYVGTPGPRQKAVVHLVDPSSGECTAVVKVPLGAEAGRSIVHESSVLTLLVGESCTLTPRLLFVDRRTDVTTQTFVPGISGSRKLLPEYIEVLRSLVLHDEQTCLAGHVDEWRWEWLTNGASRNSGGLLALGLAEMVDTTSLPACWLHGDFAPWNIRQHPGRPPALIDWEMAERGGLPLQDAYHFLFEQDFLFGKSASSHVSDVQPFASSLDISSELCRKLQIAYLVQSYLNDIEVHEPRRAEFLLKALAKALQEHTGLRRWSPPAKRRLRLVSSRSSHQGTVRAELFSAVVVTLNRSGIPYCVLGGHEESAAASGGDVDIMFLPGDLRRVSSILQQCAKTSGAQLVQCIRHETSACYFILARVEGKHVTHLALDCYGDYRRDGRTWLQAAPVIAGRRRYKNFYRPGIPDHFIYLLIKKVLKQTLTLEHVTTMQHLFARNPNECRRRIERFWSPETQCHLERATVQQNLDWFQQQLPSLQMELLRSRKVQRLSGRFMERLHEIRRFFERVLHPTGLSVLVVGAADSFALDLADQVACSLASAFRRTSRLCEAASSLHGIRLAVQMRAIRIRSTLAVYALAETQESGRRLPGRILQWILKPDVVLHLHNDSSAIEPDLVSACVKGEVLLEATDPPEIVLTKANQAVLDRLATRTATRLKLCVTASEPTSGVPNPPASKEEELEFVGSD